MNNYKLFFREIYKNCQTMTIQETDDEIDFVTEMLTGLKTKDFLLGKEISAEEKEKIKNILQNRVDTGKPLQYLVGKSFFAGKKYFVNEKTLIPRPETEFLVNECIKRNTLISPKILDIGTGSGCIAIELAQSIRQAQITACDILQETLDTALKNAVFHNVSDRIDFIKSDLFGNISGKFDIIVSNPPYIDYEDTEEVQKEVFEYEPHIALFAKDKGLFFYKEIIKQSNRFLNKNGLIAFEIGWKQAEKVADLLKENGFVNILFTKDLDNVNRVVSAVKIN